MESSDTQHPHHVPAEQLRSYDEIRERVMREGPSRAFAALRVWGAVVMAAYCGAFLFSLSAHPADAAPSGAGSAAYTVILLLPVLVFGSLLSGAQERFSIRSTAAPGYWVAYSLIIAGFMTLGALSIAGVNYPWGLNLLVPAALVLTTAINPIRQLLRASTPDSDRWSNQPLSRAARWSTASIGIALGLLAASSTQAWFLITQVLMMVALTVVLIGWRAPWGLPRTGFQWGPVHWTAFGIALSVMFALAVLLSRTDWITAGISVGAGILIVLVMVVASFLPRHPEHTRHPERG